MIFNVFVVTFLVPLLMNKIIDTVMYDHHIIQIHNSVLWD